jgi:hypothetical protein
MHRHLEMPPVWQRPPVRVRYAERLRFVVHRICARRRTTTKDNCY